MATKVRYLCSMGMSEGPGIQTGDEATVPDDEAQRLIERNLAEAVAGTKASTKAAGAKKATSKAAGTKASKAADAETPEG
jgi:topoisomerase IA-like protein